MCMIMVEKVDPKDLPQFAYKVCSEEQRIHYVGPFSQTRMEPGVWMKSIYEPAHKLDLEERYPYGFHVFGLQSDAERYKKRYLSHSRLHRRYVAKVEIRGKAFKGECQQLPAYSVDEVKFPEELPETLEYL